jgi:hypothetical protein
MMDRWSMRSSDFKNATASSLAPTFATELIWGKLQVAKFRLAWIFVKSEIENPLDANGPYILVPHFARTLTDLNNSTPEPISDHSPMTVDLPFHEPAHLGTNRD